MSNRNSRNRRMVRRALARRQGKQIVNPTNASKIQKPNSMGYGGNSIRNYTHDFTPKSNNDRAQDSINLPTKKDIPSKQIMHPTPYNEIQQTIGIFSRSGVYKNIGTIQSENGSRNDWEGQEGGECQFTCNGVDIWVAPGDCVRCPEQAYCPDNFNCRVRHSYDDYQSGNQYFDAGFACCGCAAAYGGTGGPFNTENYGKRLGRSYVLWAGDNDADDGRWLSNYYGCRQEHCIPSNEAQACGNTDWPSCDDGGLDDDWLPNGEYFYAGPFSPDSAGGDTGFWLKHMFYWAGDAPRQTDLFFEPGYFFSCDGCYYEQVDLTNLGAGFPHMACAEWGWDCGDILNTRRAHEQIGCAGPDRLAKEAAFGDAGFHEMYPDLTFTPNNATDCVEQPYIYERERFLGWETYGGFQGLGPSTDPNKHCGFTFGQGGTCKGKCNRKRYIEPTLADGSPNPYFIAHPDGSGRGWDPGGFEFKSRGDGVFGGGPNICYCDYGCASCGCDINLFYAHNGVDEDFAIDAYNECLGNCPSDCVLESHIEFFGPIPDTGYDTGYGSYQTKFGTNPGVDCNVDNDENFMGDCCRDYIMECVTERSPLPCECYDLKEFDHGNEDEENLSTEDLVNYGQGWWLQPQQVLDTLNFEPGLVYSGIIWSQPNDSNCAGRCSEFCTNRGFSIEADVWNNLLNDQDVDNRQCVMEHINRNIFGYNPNNYNDFDWLNYWISIPTCIGNLADSAWMGGSSSGYECHCACGCDQYTAYTNNQFFAENRKSNPDIGCGGLLPDGMTEANVCNYQGSYGYNSEDFNCSVEYIESLNDPWYTANIPTGSPRCNFVSDDTYLGPNIDMDYQFQLVQGIVPQRVVYFYLLLQSYIDQNCTGTQWNNMLNPDNPDIDACPNGYALAMQRKAAFQKGCMGCADPTAGNYTGDVIKVPGTDIAMDCSGTGAGEPDEIGNYGDTSCCYYESGCNDANAFNWLPAGDPPVGYSENKNNEPAGGLASFNEQSNSSYPMTSIEFCKLLDALGGYETGDIIFGDLEQCAESLTHIYPHGSTTDDFIMGRALHPYCFAPNGCKTAGESEEVCVYEEVKYCNDVTACNFSAECANADSDQLIETNLGLKRCTNDNSVCITNVETGKISFCSDSDGDCSVDPGSGIMAFGCNPEILNLQEYPLDSEEYYLTDDFTSENNVAGYLYQEDPNFGIDGAACVGLLVGGPDVNGYPLRPCSNQTDDFIACPTNTTHASTNRSRWCTAYNYVPDFYPSWSGDGVQKSWMGQEFDINHCCSESVGGETIAGVDYPPCYQDDDCGNCDEPGVGIFVQLDGSDVPLPYYNTADGVNSCFTNEVGGTMNIWNDTLSAFPIGIGTAQYLNTRTGITSCNCSGDTSLSCNCNIPEQNYIGNVCGMNYALDCASICPYQGEEPSSTDECGVCDGPGADDFGCCPYESPYCIQGGVNCGPPDCSGVCGGPKSFFDFAVDGDGDFFCQAGITQHCTFILEDGNPDSTPGDNYILESLCQGIDANDEIDCPTNNIDDCLQCVGEGEEVDVPNQSQDCSGVCFGDAFVDDCGTCSCPPEGISAEAGCPNGVVQEPNSEKDQCGLCPDETLISKDILGFDVTLTWGSFGCESGDWYGTQFEISNQSAFCGPFGGDQFGADRGNGILHCGCQCAGCTNPSSPAWTPYSKYDIERNDTIDWLFGDPFYPAINDVDDYVGLNYCWEEMNHHLYKYSKQVIDVAYDRFGSYCDPNVVEQIESTFGSDLIKYCLRFDSSLCILGNEVVDCSVNGAQTMDDFLTKTVESNGWYWHGNVHFKYCENPLPGNPECGGEVDMNCVGTYGPDCCGTTGNNPHCRSGVRSEFYWQITRAEDEFGDVLLTDDDFPYGAISPAGDVNFDGTVNIQDIVILINHIMNDTPLTGQQFLAADINSDGVVDILDIVSLVNLILSRNNASGRSSQTELTPEQTNRLINLLKPHFNNSTYTVMQLVDSMGRKVGRRNNTSRTTNTRNCASDYCFDYFNFVLNAPTCIPENVEIEFGDGFDNWASQSAVVDGPNNSIILGVVGNNQTSVEANIGLSRMFFTIYHPNVRIQSDEDFRQTQSFLPGNVIKFLPESTSTSCVGISQENDSLCSNVSLENCNSESLCQLEYATNQEYESRGVFGYGFSTWNTFENGCADSGNDCTGHPTRYYYLPNEHQCS